MLYPIVVVSGVIESDSPKWLFLGRPRNESQFKERACSFMIANVWTALYKIADPFGVGARDSRSPEMRLHLAVEMCKQSNKRNY
jgi:hypothetical protein